MNGEKSRYTYAGIMGLVVGDALGVPVEFTSREERDADPVVDMRAYGSHEVPAGTWSDDSSMALATLEWLVKDNPADYKALMDKFCAWLYKADYTPYGEVFDCGITVNKAIRKFQKLGINPLECGEKEEDSNGNGSLMRILPAALYYAKDLASESISCARKIYDISSLTHGHARSKLGCLIYSKIVADIVMSPEDKKDSVKYSLGVLKAYLSSQEKDGDIVAEMAAYHRLWEVDSFARLPRNEISSGGYVVDSLEAALWCFLNTDSYKDCVLMAVNLGRDTDTVAAIAGGLAGVYYGFGEIPEEWIEAIPRREWIEDKILEYSPPSGLSRFSCEKAGITGVGGTSK